MEYKADVTVLSQNSLDKCPNLDYFIHYNLYFSNNWKTELWLKPVVLFSLYL